MRIQTAVAVLCLSSVAAWAGFAAAQGAQSPSPQAGAPAPEVEVAPLHGAPQPDDGFSRPPPGSPQDQALWKAARDVDDAIPLQRGESAKLQWRVRQGQFNERLEQLEKQGTPDKAKRARETAVRLLAIRDGNYEIITRRWPIDPTRVCSYPLLEFTSALASGQGPAEKGQQEEARKRLKECVDKAQLILRSIEGSNRELAAALETLEAELPPGIPVTGPAGVPPPVPASPPGPMPGSTPSTGSK